MANLSVRGTYVRCWLFLGDGGGNKEASEFPEYDKPQEVTYLI